MYTGRPSRAIFKSEPMGNSADSYNLTWKIDSYAPIEEYKLMFRKLFVSFKKFTLSAESLVNIFRISLTKQMTLIVSGTR